MLIYFSIKWEKLDKFVLGQKENILHSRMEEVSYLLTYLCVEQSALVCCLLINTVLESVNIYQPLPIYINVATGAIVG